MTQAVIENTRGIDARAGSGPIVSQEWIPGEHPLRDAWIAIAHSPHVKARPIRRLIHSQPYYLWREGSRVLAAECHPAQAQARYSEFTGGSGRYPALERYGYVWVWYGNPDNASEELIPDVPYLPRAGVKPPRNMWGQIYFDCAYELCAENLMDLVHADYLHADVVGNEINEGDHVTVESTSETVTMTREVTGKQIPPALRALGIRAKQADYKAVAHVHVRSGVVILHGKFTPGFSQPLFHPLIPESRQLCRTNYTFNITDGPAIARNLFPIFSYKIGPQDNFMMRVQNPRYMEPAGRRDVSTRFDSAASRYRMVMSKLIRRQGEGDFSYLADADPAADIADVLGCKRAS
jgi:vanillate O-demethylase oxygenase-like protein